MYYGFKIIYNKPNEVSYHEKVTLTKIDRDITIVDLLRRGNTEIMSSAYGVI